MTLVHEEQSVRARKHLERREAAAVHMPADLLLADELAPKIGMAPSTLCEKCRKLQFPFRRLPFSRRLLFDRGDVEAYLNGACELEVQRLAGNGVIVKPKKRGSR